MNAENQINFDDIVGVQGKMMEENDRATVMAFVLRVKHKINDIVKIKDEDFPKLTVTIEKTKIDENEYKEFSGKIIKNIIDKMDEIATQRTFSEEKDFGLLNVMFLCNKIALKTRRGAGNFAIFSEDLYEKFVSTNPNNIIDGKLNGNIKIYNSPYLKQKVIVGFKGTGVIDTGLVLYKSQDESQYQLIDIDAGNYYAVLEVK